MVTPDANAIYNTIYQDFYYGGAGIESEKYEESNWIIVGNSQIKSDWTTGELYYRFK